MNSQEETLNTFVTRARQMVLRFKELQQENSELYDMVDSRDQEIARLKKELQEKEQNYNSLKMARMLSLSDDDIEATKARLAALIRDINKCIAVLTDQKSE